MKKLCAFLVASVLMAAVAQAVVINEIMYNPPESGTDTNEFLELYNPDLYAVSLSDWYFDQGIEFTFPLDAEISALGFVVVAELTNELWQTYPDTLANADAVYQWTGGALNNGGEDIDLRDAESNQVDYVDYDDSPPWPTEPDGNGPSLELIWPYGENNTSTAWGASLNGTTNMPGGSPGVKNTIMKGTYQTDFEGDALGSLPEGWRILENWGSWAPGPITGYVAAAPGGGQAMKIEWTSPNWATTPSSGEVDAPILGGFNPSQAFQRIEFDMWKKNWRVWQAIGTYNDVGFINIGDGPTEPHTLYVGHYGTPADLTGVPGELWWHVVMEQNSADGIWKTTISYPGGGGTFSGTSDKDALGRFYVGGWAFEVQLVGDPNYHTNAIYIDNFTMSAIDSPDWPLVGGGWPKHGQNMHNTGLSPHNTPVDAADGIPTEYVPMWRAYLEPGASGLQAGRTVLTWNNVLVAAADYTLQCFDRITGERLWRAPLGKHGWQWMQSSAPLITSDGMIYVGGSDSLYAFSLGGTSQWTGTVTTGADGWVGGSPAISPDGLTVYCPGCCDNDGSKLVAFSAADGATNWAFDLEGSSWAAPAVDSNGVIYIGGGVSWSPDGASTEYKIRAINPDGTEKWSVTNDVTKYVVMQNMQLSPDGSKVVFNDFNDDGTTRRVTALNVGDGSVAWQIGTPQVAGMDGFPSLGMDQQGNVYCNMDNGFHRFDSTGGVVWVNTNIVSGFTPAISADGVVWTKSDLTETLVGLTSSNGVQVAQVNLGADSRDWTTPAIGDDGDIFITTKSNVYCLTRSPKVGWCNLQWPFQIVVAPTGGVPETTENVYGQIWIDGVTSVAGPTPGLSAWLGYGPKGELPNSPDWTWIPAVFNADVGNNDEFMTNITVDLGVMPAGVYGYGYRYQWSTNGLAGGYYYGLSNNTIATLATYDPELVGSLVVIPEPVVAGLLALLVVAFGRHR